MSKVFPYEREREQRLADLFFYRNAALLAWQTYSHDLDSLNKEEEGLHIGTIIPHYNEWREQWGKKGKMANPLTFKWLNFNGNGVDDVNWLSISIDLLHDELLYWRTYNIANIERHELYVKLLDYVMSMERFYWFVTGHRHVSMRVFKTVTAV